MITIMVILVSMAIAIYFGDWIKDCLLYTSCYASFMKRFTGHKEEWGTFLDVKHWPEIKNPKKYVGQRVVIGSVTDGYNPQEEQFGNTRKLQMCIRDRFKIVKKSFYRGNFSFHGFGFILLMKFCNVSFQNLGRCV